MEDYSSKVAAISPLYYIIAILSPRYLGNIYIICTTLHLCTVSSMYKIPMCQLRFLINRKHRPTQIDLTTCDNVALRTLCSWAGANLRWLATTLRTSVAITIFGANQARVGQAGGITKVGVDTDHYTTRLGDDTVKG